MNLRMLTGLRFAGALQAAAATALALLLAGCASPPPPLPPAASSYVVLLDNPDGTSGKVRISTVKGVTMLEKNRQAVRFSDPPGNVFEVSQDRINKDFSAALAAMPVRPASFLLYFAPGGTRLTTESEAVILKILAEIANRAVPDISVIGHTDTSGSGEDNEKLGLDRARFVADLIGRSNRIDPARMAVESHGEKNLLVATPDNSPEARNRRVEVTVR